MKAPADFVARERFRDEWSRNFAVSANAGSGKTTAISERLAAMALAPAGAELLKKTAVVTFTKKAAAQIGRRAREILLRRLAEAGRRDLAPLDALERAFFGTIHSFCLLLARRHGQSLGLHLNPEVLDEAHAERLWQAFVEQDAMQFASLSDEQMAAVLRHLPLDEIFPLAQELDAAAASQILSRPPCGGPPEPDAAALAEILNLIAKQKRSVDALARNQTLARDWARRFRDERGFLPFVKPEGDAQNIQELFARFFAPVKAWVAQAAAVLAAELAGRFRTFRFERGVQTYADQIDAALAVLHDATALEKIRAEGWRVVLDEAQDTDPQQFAVLVEVTRPPGAEVGTWPERDGPLPRPGHFSLVGDGQQSIYGSRADLRNFQKHIGVFARGDGGEQLIFDVTFRSPRSVVACLNRTLPAAFSPEREHNRGVPIAEGAVAPNLQVPFTPLVPGPENVEGAIGVMPLTIPSPAPSRGENWLAEEARQLAAWLGERGPAGVGARSWSEICVLAPRNDWLLAARHEFESRGLKTALQLRRNRNGDHPVYAWLAGLLAALCDPANAFEWVGVLREIFSVSDAQLAEVLREEKVFRWNEPEIYPEPLRGALETLRPFVSRVDEEGLSLERFARELIEACALADKAQAIDATGAAAAELERLLAQAVELGLRGGGPRAWLRELLREIDTDRPAGAAADDALNLLTVHSAKGLEWPVVILLGLWRGIGQLNERGLRLLRDPAGAPRIFFDQASLPADTAEARARERLRENTRLLYVALTRARRTLLLPWAESFGGKQREKSFAELWNVDFSALPIFPRSLEATAAPKEPEIFVVEKTEKVLSVAATQPPNLPARLLPYQLARSRDAARAARHEAALDEPGPAREGDEAVDYGLWWHETMEFWPWGAAEAAYVERALRAAEARGFAARAEMELEKFRRGDLRAELDRAEWARQAELSVFAPLRPDAWIDGVIDLVARDAKGGRILIIDWKTNQRRAGESDEALLERLAAEYAPQLAAYGACVQSFFPGEKVELRIFSSTAGGWRVVAK